MPACPCIRLRKNIVTKLVTYPNLFLTRHIYIIAVNVLFHYFFLWYVSKILIAKKNGLLPCVGHMYQISAVFSLCAIKVYVYYAFQIRIDFAPCDIHISKKVDRGARKTDIKILLILQQLLIAVKFVWSQSRLGIFLFETINPLNHWSW